MSISVWELCGIFKWLDEEFLNSSTNGFYIIDLELLTIKWPSSLSFRGLSFANFKNEYQMTFLDIDHESGFKALHPNDSSKKRKPRKENLRFVLIIIIVISIMTLEYSKPSNDRKALCCLKLKIINNLFFSYNF